MRLLKASRWRSFAAAGLAGVFLSACSSVPDSGLQPSAAFTCVDRLGGNACLQDSHKKTSSVALETGPKLIDTGDVRGPSLGYGVTLRFDFLNPK